MKEKEFVITTMTLDYWRYIIFCSKVIFTLLKLFTIYTIKRESIIINKLRKNIYILISLL